MKNNITDFTYPIVFKHIHGFLTVSVPDLGIDAKVALPNDFYQPKKLEENKEIIWQIFSEVLKDSVSHLENKKWIPDASQIKTQLKAAEKDYSLPEFCRAVQNHITVSENTLRREISKGKIICYITEGGHRRIPESEVQRYIKSSQKAALKNNPEQDGNL
jgi:excisionase family DNA binding protein